SPDGRTLASGGGDALVRLYDLPAGRLRQTLREPTDEVRSLAFAPDGRTLAGCGADKTLRLWDGQTAKERLAVAGVADRVLAFHPDGQKLATACASTLVVRDAASGQSLREFQRPWAPLNAVHFTPHGALLVGRDQEVVYVWDARSAALRFM